MSDGTWGRHHAEHLADEAAGCPARQGDRPTRTTDAEQLGRGRLLVGANIDPKTESAASNDASGNGSASASPSNKLDVEPLGGRADAAPLEQRRDVVDADGGTAEAGGGDRGVPAAGGDVEHAPAGVKVGAVDEALRDRGRCGGDDGEVAARPGLLLTGLDRGEVWWSWWWSWHGLLVW